MNHSRSRIGLLTFLSALTVGGCGVETPEPIPDGLTVEQQTPMQVAGSFGKDGTGIRFAISRRDDGSRHAVVSDASGHVLQESTLGADGIETMRILDGRLTIHGNPTDPSPAHEGDENVFAELSARDDAQLLPALRENLVRAGIGNDFYRASEDPTTASSFSNNCTYQSLVYAGTSGWYATWSFWGTTNVQVCAAWANNYPWGPYGTANAYIGNFVYTDGWHRVYDWAFCPVSAGSCPFFYRTAAQWWGFSVEVYNSGPDPLGVTTW